MYLPTVQGEKLEIAIGLDTSSSVSEKEFQEFIAEVKGITDQFSDYVLHLFFCDVAIHERMTLTTHDAWPETFPKKNGGTSFVPVFNVISEEQLPIAALVYLTDGTGTYPEACPHEYAVIWILNKEYQVPWGHTITMEVDT